LKDIAVQTVNKDTEFDNLTLEFFGKLLNSDPEYIWGPGRLGK
jgi:hypothetical protein